MITAALLCTLIRIVDGDTFHAACPGPVIVRIANIDAPERRDCPAAAARSTAMLASLLIGAFTVQPLYSDRYGRTVATVTIRGNDVGSAMIEAQGAKEWPHTNKGKAREPRPKWRGCR